MKITLLLLLAGLLPAQAGEQARGREGRPAGAVPPLALAAPGVAPDQGFAVPRLLQPEVPAPLPLRGPTPGVAPGVAPGAEFQLTGPTSGVTCTLRIVPVSPAGDARILSPIAPPAGRDPIVRRDLAPCQR